MSHSQMHDLSGEGGRSPPGSGLLSDLSEGLASLRISSSRALMDSLIEEMVAYKEEICSQILLYCALTL